MPSPYLPPVRSLLSLGLLLAALGAGANNIQVANSALTGNTGTNVKVQFDISWENSWRLASGRWDAAWVFVKYRTSLTGPWLHANLSNTGHVAAGGSQIDLGLLTPGAAYNANTNPVVGVFVYRNAAGQGNLNLPGTQLQWNFAAQGLDIADIAQVQVFAIEMVYVPQGAFFVGSGGTEFGSFTDGAWVSGATIPRQITSEGAITIGQSAGNLWGTSSTGSNTIGPAGTLAAAFPKGFNAFYCMKYEVTQQQYVDFLNTLTRTQQNTRTATDVSGTAITNRYVMLNASTLISRNGIRCNATIPASPAPVNFYCDLNGNGTGGQAMDGKEIACNNLSWGDLTAYLDWSGLRPMTELEFEKACRGTIAPVANEYPWGTTGIAFSAYTLANAGATNEGIATNYSSTLGNAVYSSTNGTPSGPKRVGILAANGSNSGRVTAGASYYGIMELGGNLWERPVTIGNANGRAFTGTHGNGVLAADGNPDAANWPAPTTAIGAGFRGGAWNFDASGMRVSGRFIAAGTDSGRPLDFGGRGARLAP
jgi:formylglycine-generating enzyme required for sulfatase activity